MPILPYVNQAEPGDDAVIWRFMDLRKFRDLMASEELYFRRADLFPDKRERLPPDQYAMRVLGLDPYGIKDRVSLNNHLGSLAQNRESYYISCWHLYRQETLDMWEQYGADGVAVCSRYGLLKSALDGLLDQAHAGLVRYGYRSFGRHLQCPSIYHHEASPIFCRARSSRVDNCWRPVGGR
jgi:hypothetical protein